MYLLIVIMMTAMRPLNDPIGMNEQTLYATLDDCKNKGETAVNCLQRDFV